MKVSRQEKPMVALAGAKIERKNRPRRKRLKDAMTAGGKNATTDVERGGHVL